MTMDIYKIKAPSASGKFKNKNRTNNMGDNPLVDHDQVYESNGENTMIAKLKKELNKMGITDGSIAVGDYELSNDQIVNIMRDIGGVESVDAFYDLVAELADALFDGLVEGSSNNRLLENMSDGRFTYVLDTLGHVTVYDNDNGTSVYLRGEDANEILYQISVAEEGDGDIQLVLSQYEHVMEGGKSTDEMINEAVLSMFKRL